MLSLLNEKFKFAGNFFFFFGRIDIARDTFWNHQIQAVLCLHGSLKTRFSKITRFILVLLFVHLVLNHSSAYTVISSHGCFPKVLKNSVCRGPPLAYKYFIFSSGVVLFVMGEVIYNYFSKQWTPNKTKFVYNWFLKKENLQV